jgi:alpha-tubulin suppressor-like RCC1 family protein
VGGNPDAETAGGRSEGGTSSSGGSEGGTSSSGTSAGGQEAPLGGMNAGGIAGELAGAGGVADSSGCAIGSYDSDGTGTCKPWSECALGEFVSVPGTRLANRECAACPEGKTTTKVNADSCEIVVTQIAAGGHSCALFSDGSVACWGANPSGALGYGNLSNIGDDELPSSVGRLKIGADAGLRVTQITVGGAHTCARLSDGSARCWGSNSHGQLGRADGSYDPSPDALSTEPIVVTHDSGVGVRQLVAGGRHTCALLDDGTVTCWGSGFYGQTGYGNDDWIGDDEEPASAGRVSISPEPGVTVVQLAAGAYHTCALLSNGSLRCWGVNDLVLGRTATTGAIGDDELPSSIPPISVTHTPGVTVKQVTAGQYQTCALLSDDSLRCWGDAGKIGQGDLDWRNYTLPSDMAPVQLGAPPGVTIAQIDAGSTAHTCARFSDGSAKCWGWNVSGQLGYGNTQTIGDDELPSATGMISVTKSGASITSIVAGARHTCALLSDASVKCWGTNYLGTLGVGNAIETSISHVPAYGDPVGLY